jgi:hypothetical protein
MKMGDKKMRDVDGKWGVIKCCEVLPGEESPKNHLNIPSSQ